MLAPGKEAPVLVSVIFPDKLTFITRLVPELLSAEVCAINAAAVMNDKTRKKVIFFILIIYKFSFYKN